MKLRIEKPDGAVTIREGEYTFESAARLIEGFERADRYVGCNFLLVDDSVRPMKVWAYESDNEWFPLADVGFSPLGEP